MKDKTEKTPTCFLTVKRGNKRVQTVTIQTAVFLLLTTVLLLNSCTENGPTSLSEPDPLFTISTKNVALSGGLEGIQFFFKSNMDVVMTKVIFENPMGITETYNLYNELFISDELASCQDEDVGYYKYGGEYSFTFVGRINSTEKNFSIEKIINVNSKK